MAHCNVSGSTGALSNAPRSQKTATEQKFTVILTYLVAGYRSFLRYTHALLPQLTTLVILRSTEIARVFAPHK